MIDSAEIQSYFTKEVGDSGNWKEIRMQSYRKPIWFSVYFRLNIQEYCQGKYI